MASGLISQKTPGAPNAYTKSWRAGSARKHNRLLKPLSLLLPPLRLLAWVPLPVLHGFGILLGWVIYFSPGRHRTRMRRQIRQSGLCAAADCRRLTRRAVAEMGKTLGELPALWFRPYRRTLALVREVRGREVLDGALAEGRGAILLSPHIGSFEINSLYYAARAPVTVLYKPHRRAWINALQLAGRERGQAHLAPASAAGVRAVYKALKRGEAAGILPDQVASKGEGVWAPFFGRPAYTPVLPLTLAQKTGAPLILGVAERLSWGRGFRIHVSRLSAPGADLAAAAAMLNRAIEDAVRRFPAQYFWSYNRYKRPGGAPPPEARA